MAQDADLTPRRKLTLTRQTGAESDICDTAPIGSIDSPLLSSITPPLFHSKLKSFLFANASHRSLPFLLTPRIPQTVSDTSKQILFYFLVIFSPLF